MNPRRGEFPSEEKTIEGLAFSVGFVDNGFMLKVIHEGVVDQIPIPKIETCPDLPEIEEMIINSRISVRITQSEDRKIPNTKYELTILGGNYREQRYSWVVPS